MRKCFISLFYKHLPTFPKITNWRDCLFIIVYTCLFCHRLIDHQFSSVYSLSCVWLFATPGLQHTRPPCPSPASRVYSNSCPLSLKCHPAISSWVISFSSRLQSFPATGSFQMSQFFTSAGQSIGASASASVLHSNEYSGLISLIGLISLLSRGLSRVFCNTTVQKRQFFGAQKIELLVKKTEKMAVPLTDIRNASCGW